MHWMIGLELGSKGRGALALARWFATANTTDRDELTGLHVIERRTIAPILRDEEPEEIVQRAADAAWAEIEAADLTEKMTRTQTGLNPHADEGLAAEAAPRKVDAIIVGRRGVQEHRLPRRVGRTTTRLLRTLPTTVVVTPEAFMTEEVGDGPVIVATDLVDDSVRALHFGRRIAGRYGRELMVCHAVPDPEQALAPYIKDSVLDNLRERHKLVGDADLKQWLVEQDVKPDHTEVLIGPTADCLYDLAVRHKTLMLVLGSRCASKLERIFVPSVGFQLAVMAPCPIAVVPPDEPPAAAGRRFGLDNLMTAGRD